MNKETTRVVVERRPRGYREESLELSVQTSGRWMPRSREGWSAQRVYALDVAATAAYMFLAVAITFFGLFSGGFVGTPGTLFLTFVAINAVVRLSIWTRSQLEKRRARVQLPPRWRPAQECSLSIRPDQLPLQIRVVEEPTGRAVELRMGEEHERLVSELSQAEARVVTDALLEHMA